MAPRTLWDINTHLLFDDEQMAATLPHTPVLPHGGLAPNLYWELWIDLLGDGKFAGPDDRIPLEDVVMPISWQLGLDPYRQMARPSRATILLDNASGKYSPERPEALEGFTAYRAIKLVSGGYPFARTDGEGHFTGETESTAAEQVMFLMRISQIEPAANRYSGQPITRIEATDMLSEAGNYVASMPMQVDKYASEILEATMKQSGLYPPGTIPGFVFGQSTFGEARFGLLTNPFKLDPGSYQYPYAMDNNEPDASLYDVIRYVAETENGRFFINRAGQWEFWDRNHFSSHLQVDYLLGDEMIDLPYQYGSQVYNLVELRYQPRQVITVGTPTLVTHGSEIRVPQDGSAAVTLKFKDASGNPVSSTSVIQPVGGADYTVRDTYSSADRTGLVSLAMKATSSAAELTFTNNFHPIPGIDGDLVVNAGLRVRGNNSITAFDPISVRLQDSASVLAYGRRPYPSIVNLRFVDNYEQAVSIGQELLNTYAQPRGQARGIRIWVHDAPTWTLALKGTIGARMKIHETHTGHEQAYFVVGEKHTIREGGGKDYLLDLVLEPAGETGV